MSWTKTGPLPIKTARGVSLDFNIEPGVSVGPFLLGTPLPVMLGLIKSKSLVLSKAEFKFSDKNPLDVDLVVNLPRNGISMRFDAISQMLKSIELYDFTKFQLKYRGQEFNSIRTVPTFQLIYKLFGPIYPGEVSSHNSAELEKRYILHYPGISFVFPIPQKHWPLQTPTDLPLTFGDGSTPILNRIYVDATKNIRKNLVPSFGGPSDYYFEEVLIQLKKSVTFSKRGATIFLGAPAQVVFAALGGPSQVFSKNAIPINKDSYLNGGSANGCNSESYIWNYFILGVDIVFDGIGHTVKKFVMKTNFPGHPDFNRYRRCNFKISPLLPLEIEAPPGTYIDGQSRYDDVTKVLGQPLGPPVIYSRQGGHSSFSSTSYFGFDGVVFEIMKNSYIASVTVF